MSLSVDCIIPAAGRSERMGKWKPVLPFGSSTIIATVVVNAIDVCARVILVTGFRGEELGALFADEKRVAVIENPEWERGMFSSIRRGVAAVEADFFFITPGDMPWIRPAVYQSLLACRNADVVFPAFGGKRGHPVLFNRKVGEAVLAADPTRGRMRDIASQFVSMTLAWHDDSILRDIDTTKDYE
jgi:molybdenum cofactor cytidylyltransferase